MPCHSVGTWHGPTAGEELLRSWTATEADAARRQTSAALRQGASAPSAEPAFQSYMPRQAVQSHQQRNPDTFIVICSDVESGGVPIPSTHHGRPHQRLA